MPGLRIFIYGLDGATWNIIRPLVKVGKLPNFKKLLDIGTSGDLYSTTPPMTCPAWACMLTGKWPSDLGVNEFFTKEPNKNRAEISRLKWNRWVTLDKLLSKRNKKVALINIPTTTAQKTNGVYISGPIWEGNRGIIAYPPDLENELKKRNYRIRIDTNHLFYGKRAFFNDVNNLTIAKAELMKELYSIDDWDLFFFSLYYVDQIQHTFMKNIGDKHSPYSSYVEDHYKLLDDILGDILQMVPNKDYIFIVSDHGHQQAYRFFDLNSHLYKNGLINYYNKSKMKSLSRKNRKYERIDKMFLWLMRVFNQNMKNPQDSKTIEKLRTLYSLLQEKWNKSVDFRKNIDWENTLAYSFTHDGIYLLKDDKNNLRSVIKCLNELEYGGNRICKEIVSRNDLFGPDAPDNFPHLTVRPNIGFKSKISGRNPPERTFFEHRISSEHRLEGIFCVTGPEIQPENIEDLSLYDILPTILYMLNESIPSGLRGNVIKGIFREDSTLRKGNIRIEDRSKLDLRNNIRGLLKRKSLKI